MCSWWILWQNWVKLWDFPKKCRTGWAWTIRAHFQMKLVHILTWTLLQIENIPLEMFYIFLRVFKFKRPNMAYSGCGPSSLADFFPVRPRCIGFCNLFLWCVSLLTFKTNTVLVVWPFHRMWQKYIDHNQMQRKSVTNSLKLHFFQN